MDHASRARQSTQTAGHSAGVVTTSGKFVDMTMATRLEHLLDSCSVPVAVRLMRLTRGRLARLWHRNVLILTTTGRRSGRPRTVVVQYFPDGSDLVVVGANSGMPSHPAWYLNLTAEPRARVEIDGRTLSVRARELTHEEASAFWPQVLAQAPDYARYVSRTDRRIPLLRLEIDREPGAPTGSVRFERASAIDMMELVSATTPAAGQVGAVLMLEPGDRLDLGEVRSTLDARIKGVPRLRQRLVTTPLGCGRPIWVDDAFFDIADHVHETACPAPGDRDAVLEVAADLIARPLPRDRPLWSATLLTGLAGGGAAVFVRFHHVMADGMGGLAVLAGLVDGAPAPPTPEFPRPAPRPRSLFFDAVRSRLAALPRAGETLGRVREAAAELGRRPRRGTPCSLNRPVGSDRSLAVARADLDAIHAVARAHGASVNDAVLAAITGALARLLADRGEAVDRFVVSIPVSGRAADTGAELGNQIGIMAVDLPASGAPGDRIEAIAAITGSQKRAHRGASPALLVPVFRLLDAVGLLRWFTDHQQMVNTFVTNLRGPDTQVRLLDRTVEELIPVNSTSGNVRVAFGVFSYARALTVTVVADASLRGELADLVEHLQNELDAGAATANPQGR